MATIPATALLNQLKAFSAALTQQAPGIVETMALTGSSLVIDRIQREGVGSYSNNEVPTFYFAGKELNAGGKSYLEDNDTGTWGDFRSAQGLQSSYVDLTYSGRMFGGLTPLKRFQQGTKFIVQMGGTDKEVDEKLFYNIQRYGDFLQPNEAEQREVDEIAQDALEALLKKYLN